MLYTIVFESRATRALSAADAKTALQALALAEALRLSGDIKYIKTPQEGEFGVEMLRTVEAQRRMNKVLVLLADGAAPCATAEIAPE